ncbi:MAG: type III-A CRISPR-associated protein Csm2 [Magnetococcus sp. DMHC-1]
MDTSKIKFDTISADLFDAVAREAAEILAKSDKKINKPTQIRRFYDEICMWAEKVEANDVAKFKEFLPFIKMLNAKAAYAHGRKLVDDNFVKLLRDCLSQVNDPKTMKSFKLFMEALMGFYKEKRPKDS